MKGRLKLYFGYAAGVGKTYRMLEDAQELRKRGVDIVIGYFEPHGRQDTIAKTEGLAVVPRCTIPYGGTTFEEMDTAGILDRRPAVALVDELAHTNVPGSERAKRWEDVRVLLESGMDVWTTMNVQHLESLNDQVCRATGVRVRETVPDWVVDEADEVVLIDLTPPALRNRLERGVVYAPDKARRAMDHFFTEPNLAALREMAMRHAAHEVDGKIQAAAALPEVPAQRERILICLTGNPSSAALIRRGKRIADYLRAGCVALHVARGELDEAVERHLSLAQNLRIEAHILEAQDVAGAIAAFARSHGVTQIFLGRSRSRPRWWKKTIAQRVVRDACELPITIVSERWQDLARVSYPLASAPGGRSR